MNRGICLSYSRISLVKLFSPRFLELWKVLYPNAVDRPRCDIAGKCDTCYNIDVGRKNATCDAEAEQFKKAHLLHRGGLFMLERQE